MKIFPEKFRFSFVKDGETTYCKYAPEEWNNSVIKWDRDKKSNGILTKYVDNFSFVMDDADYLRECFAKDAVFAKVRFVVEEYDSGQFVYKQYYAGDIDFYSYEEDLYTVKVSLLEIGYKVAFDANYDTTYEIESPESYDYVSYDRINLKNMIEFRLSCNPIVIEEELWVLDSFVSTENIYVDRTMQNSVLCGKKNTDNWIFKALENCELSMKIGLYMPFVSYPLGSPRTDRELHFKIYKNDEVVRSHIVDNSGVFPGSPSSGIWVDEFKIFLESGDCVYLAFSSKGGKTSCYCLESSIILSYDSRGRGSAIPGIRPSALLSELIAKVTDNKYDSIDKSLLEKAEIKNMLITSGDLIRQIRGAKIKTSLKDFLEAMKVMFGLAYTFEMIGGKECLVIKHVNDMFKRDLRLISVNSEIRDLKMTVTNDYVYNRLKMGYKDNVYDEVNGKFEFNTEEEFAVNTAAKSKELKLISPYRADMYGVEFLIVNNENKETKDSGNDNDVFVIHTGKLNVNTMNYYEVNRDYKLVNASETSAGVTTFNVYLSPKNCLLRQIEYIRSLFVFSGDTLKFVSSLKDFAAISTGNIREHENVDLSGPAMFKPIVYEFETMVPENISDLMETNYNGYVEVRYGERVLRGFVLSLSENPGRNKSQTWKLLAMAD